MAGRHEGPPQAETVAKRRSGQEGRHGVLWEAEAEQA